MMHVFAYYNSALGTTVNTDTVAVVDNIIPIQNSHAIPNDDMQIIAAYAGSPTMLRARINSPTLRQFFPPKILPFNKALLPPNDPHLQDFRSQPLHIPGRQEIQVELTANPGTTEAAFAFLILQDRFVQAPAGDIFTLRGTATTTCVVGAWTACPVTWDDSLPPGIYSVVGGACYSAGGIAFRIIMDNFYFRPGGVMGATPDLRAPLWQYNGGMGEWGQFRSVSFPRLEVLSSSADTAETLFLNVIRVSTGIPQG
jgi:hypothetical protein